MPSPCDLRPRRPNPVRSGRSCLAHASLTNRFRHGARFSGAIRDAATRLSAAHPASGFATDDVADLTNFPPGIPGLPKVNTWSTDSTALGGSQTRLYLERTRSIPGISGRGCTQQYSARRPFNPMVVGSSPTRPTSESPAPAGLSHAEWATVNPSPSRSAAVCGGAGRVPDGAGDGAGHVATCADRYSPHGQVRAARRPMPPGAATRFSPPLCR
jgi:hypothetical protein